MRGVDPTRSMRVLVGNDTATKRAALRAALRPEPDIEVIAEVADGREAVAATLALRPSVVIMDVTMLRLDGFAAARRIMAAAPTPIVLVSSASDAGDRATVLEAMGSGALMITEALPPARDPSYPLRRAALAQMVRAMSQVRVHARHHGPANGPISKAVLAGPEQDRAALPVRSGGSLGKPLRAATSPLAVDAIGVVASAGGPAAFAKVLAALPHEGIPPILLVQHVARGFVSGLASWLSDATGHPAEVAEHGAAMHAGRVYVAPDDRHLGVTTAGRIALSDEPPVGLFKPSGTHLLRSLAAALGPRALGLVLTGMGDDGADGALDLRRAGGRVAAQDEATSTIFSMPRAAMERGAVVNVVPIDRIAPWICSSLEVSACSPS